ncbi:hypothetical protein AVEN_206709-1 [Araneus ventricosus]|uniref:Mos1 transposase HTH domain-containing protein n=1 Tax=Araneus ventricosus TaxID=182803 RepID=A0A4Y2S4X9_ARAVE|nr:hypothetical protein AVEN_206709-1 [Araneus ventricosus]
MGANLKSAAPFGMVACARPQNDRFRFPDNVRLLLSGCTTRRVRKVSTVSIADPADCEVCSVIRFLNAKNVKPAEIHRQLADIYGENVMTDGMVRKWVRQFNDGRTNVRGEARSGRPSVVNDGSATGMAGGVSQQELSGQMDCRLTVHTIDCEVCSHVMDGFQKRLTAVLVKEGGHFEPLYQ